MNPKTPLLATMLVLELACKKGAGSYDPSQGVSPGTVLSTGQPESVFDPNSGKAEPNAAGLVNKFAAPAADDLRLDAPKTQTQPTPNVAFDPRTFKPGGTYTADAGVPLRSLVAGQISVPSDGKAAVHPACTNPFPAPGNTLTTGLAVDGDLSDWPVGALVAISSASHMASADLDLRQVYFARDTSNVFLGIKIADTWVTPNPGTRQLIIQLTPMTMPVDESSSPSTAAPLQYYVRGNQLFTDLGPLAQGTGAGQVDYSVAVKGSSIEVRLPRATLDPTLGTTFALQVLTEDFTNNRFGRIGTHLVGLADDYACMVPMPNGAGTYDHATMMVFRRGAGVGASQAEIAYRAVMAAAQAVDFIGKDHLTAPETIAVTVTPSAQTFGVSDSIGLYVQDKLIDELGDAGTPREYFRVGGYMYADLYAYYDYLLPTAWSCEGFARWMSLKAMGSYYGPAVQQYERYADAARFQTEEAANPGAAKYLDDQHWRTAPFSGRYYTAKAGTYLDLLARLVDPAELLAHVFQQGRNGWPLYNSDDFLNQLKDRHTYKGAAGDDLQGGWLEGEYTGSALPLSLVADDDFDGLLAYQEAAFLSDPTQIDTGHDGVADLAKVWLGLDPAHPKGLTSLVVDNYLGDWDLLLPGVLQSGLKVSSTTAPCGADTTITRYAAVFAEGWLVVPVELESIPTATAGVTIFLQIQAPNAVLMTIQQAWGSQIYYGANTATAAVRSAAPFVGRTLELAVNAPMLGWTDGKLPTGTTVTINTIATGATAACSSTAALTPKETLP